MSTNIMDTNVVDNQRQCLLESLKQLCPDMPGEIARRIVAGEAGLEVAESLVVVTPTQEFSL